MNDEASKPGVWIVQASDEDDGRIVGVLQSREEAEELANDLAPFYSDLGFAFIPIGYRAGPSR